MEQPSSKQSNYEHRILENLSTAVLLLNCDLRLKYLNPSAEILLAVSARQVHDIAISSLLQCEGNVLELHLQEAVNTGQPLTEREIVIAVPDGRVLTVDCSVIPLNEYEGEPGLLVEVQQVDRHLRISREEQLLSQNQVARDLVRGLAHEIKNPLGGLRGAAQLLESEIDDELKEYTHVIIEEADRLRSLLDRMLGPNRLPDYTDVNIHLVLERVRALVKAEVGDSISLQRDYDPSIPEIHGDMDQLIQVVLNIVRNAVRATGPGGHITMRTRVQRQFTLGNKRHNLVAQVDIIDDGPGIPPEIIEKIFYPMVTSGTGGVGLGLSIAQSLINSHKGLIECSSKPGETIFTIYIPLEVT